jgi:hypothetical protein
MDNSVFGTLIQLLLGTGTVIGAITPDTYDLSAVGTQEIRIAAYRHTNADCSAYGPIRMVVVRPPKFGHIESRPASVFPNFSKEIIQSACNNQKIEAQAVYFRAHDTFHGPDEFEFLIIYADNSIRKCTVKMQVY